MVFRNRTHCSILRWCIHILFHFHVFCRWQFWYFLHLFINRVESQYWIGSFLSNDTICMFLILFSPTLQNLSFTGWVVESMSEEFLHYVYFICTALWMSYALNLHESCLIQWILKSTGPSPIPTSFEIQLRNVQQGNEFNHLILGICLVSICYRAHGNEVVLFLE